MNMTKNDKWILGVLERTMQFRDEAPTMRMIFKRAWRRYAILLGACFFEWFIFKDSAGGNFVLVGATCFFLGAALADFGQIRKALRAHPVNVEITDYDKVQAKIEALKSQT